MYFLILAILDSCQSHLYCLQLNNTPSVESMLINYNDNAFIYNISWFSYIQFAYLVAAMWDF